MGVLVFGVVGCGGGGSDAPIPVVEEVEETISPIEATMNENIVIPKEALEIQSIQDNNGSEIAIIKGKIDDADKLIDTIVFLPQSDINPSAMFMKVADITEETDPSSGEVISKVSYTVPQLNEVISEFKIEPKNMIDENTKVAQIVIPTPAYIVDDNSIDSVPLGKRLNVASSDGALVFGNADVAIDIGFGTKSNGEDDESNVHFNFKDLILSGIIPRPLGRNLMI